MVVRERPADSRAAFLADACDGDSDLRREVESLLGQDESGLLDRPAADLISRAVPGALVGPYEIVSRIGAGGMGEVWKARDTRLSRFVAIKFSKLGFSARFRREAEAIASLNHTNICTLHDVGPNYLVMELIEGPTLADRIQKGPIPLDEALAIGKQITGALEAAHENGIVHRDLKPANIKIRPDGSVKVLDFGLAISAAQSEVTPDSPTRLSMSGTILGTAGYMSPEQARGEPVDKRTDIFAFGVVLYEMITGERLFDGPTVSDTIAAVLTRDPAYEKVPPQLRRLLSRCLEKDPGKRLRDIGDAWDLAHHARVVPRYAIAAAVAVLLLAGGAFWWQRAHARPLTDRDVLVMADFTNTTGDPVFDGALRLGLAFELEKSPFLKIMDDQEVNQTLQLMGRPAGQRITNDIAREVCVRTGQKATLDGSIASLGRTYQIVLQVSNCQTGATLAREQAEGEDKEHVLKALAKAAAGMRAKLGESLSSIQRPGSSMDTVTTTSLDALRAFHLGSVLLNSDSPRDAIPQFQRAIELDPDFATAYEALGLAYANSGDPVRRKEYYTKAFTLAQHASERERLYISATYYRIVAHEPDKAIDTYEVQARTYPRDPTPHNGLMAMYNQRGEWEKALEEALETLRLGPRGVQFVVNVMNAYVNLDRFEEAKATAQRAFSQKLDGPSFHLVLLIIAFIQDDHSAQDKEIDWFAGKPEQFRYLGLEAVNAMALGQRRKANELVRREVEIARRQGVNGAQVPPAFVVNALLMGDCEAARKDKSSPVLALCGDAAAVRLAVEQAAKNPPPDPDTTDLLYLRGLAGLRAGKGAEAAAEFQKILDHKGRNWGPLYSLAYLGLARADALAGDTAKAKKAYQDFLALWKDADPDLPTLIAARKEYAALM